MLFPSLEYLLFLTGTFALFWVLARWPLWRITFLAVSGAVFYMAWRPEFILLLAGTTAVDYLSSTRIHQADNARTRKAWLVLSLSVNLGVLFSFKYAGWALRSVDDALHLFGLDVAVPMFRVVLPVGISFYTFEAMSYVIDVYQRRAEPASGWLRYGAFISFFPHLVAGPIIRARTFLPQLDRAPMVDDGMVGKAVALICLGMLKKVAIGDFLAVNLNDRVFDIPENFSALETLAALYGYTMQIYCDFSGYTDVATGSALLFGIRLPRNFDRPYLSTSVQDFWRRWHQTLSTWLRDYVYYPLGGSRGGRLATYRNLMITLVVAGIWHGAAWTFVLYGLLHGTGMVVNRYLSERRKARLLRQGLDPRTTVVPLTLVGRVWRIALTMQFIVLSRILFRSESLDKAERIVSRLLTFDARLVQIAPSVWLVLVGAFVLHWTPPSWWERIVESFKRLPAVVQGATAAAVGALLMQVASSEVVPFIYFQF